jgi:hypothetical protein
MTAPQNSISMVPSRVSEVRRRWRNEQQPPGSRRSFRRAEPSRLRGTREPAARNWHFFTSGREIEKKAFDRKKASDRVSV